MSRDMAAAAPVGRQRANNFYDIGVVGRRTGLTIRENVKKDADGLDNIDDFWRDDDEEDVEDDVEEDEDYEDGADGDDEETVPPRDEYYGRQQGDDYPASRRFIQQQQQPQRRLTQWHTRQLPRLQAIAIPEELLNSTPSSRRIRREGSSSQINSRSTGSMSLSSSADIIDPTEAVAMIAGAGLQQQQKAAATIQRDGVESSGPLSGIGHTPSRFSPYLAGANAAAMADDDNLYQSPAFSSVKKRLVFDNDLSESESDLEAQQPLAPPPRPRNLAAGGRSKSGGSNTNAIFGEQVLSPSFSFPAKPSQRAALAASISRQTSTLNPPLHKGGFSSGNSSSNMATLETALAQQRQANQQASMAGSSSKAFDLFGSFDHADVDEYYNEFNQHRQLREGQWYGDVPVEEEEEEEGEEYDDDGNDMGDWQDADEPPMEQEGEAWASAPAEASMAAIKRNVSKTSVDSRATTATTARVAKGKGTTAPAAFRRKQSAAAVAPARAGSEDDDGPLGEQQTSSKTGSTALSGNDRSTRATTAKGRRTPAAAAAARVPSAVVDLSDSGPADDAVAVPQLSTDSKKKAPKKATVTKKAKNITQAATVPQQTDDDDREHPQPLAKPITTKPKAPRKSKATTHHPLPAPTVLEIEKLETAVVPSSQTNNDSASGVRRSGRQRVHTLEYWKNERVVYGTDKGTQVPVAMAVVRAASVEPTHKSRKRKRAGSAPVTTTARGGARKATGKASAVAREEYSRKQSHKVSGKSQRKESTSDNEGKSSDDDEDDDNTDTALTGAGEGFEKVGENLAETVQYGTDGDIVLREIAITKSMYQFTEVQSGGYSFYPSFRDGGFMSSGVMKFPVGGSKPNKNSNASSMVFFVVKGKVKVTIYKTTFVLGSGGSFHVPRGNQYKIENVANKESILCFFQAKPMDENWEQQQEQQQLGALTTSHPSQEQRQSKGNVASGIGDINKGKAHASQQQPSMLLSGVKRPVSKPGSMPPPSSGGSSTKGSSSKSQA